MLNVPMNSKLNYFECEFVSKRSLLIGIGPKDCHLANVRECAICYVAHTGDVIRGYAYRGQGCEEQKVMLQLTCEEHDRIGCGIDFDDPHHTDFMNVFFTKNEKQVGNRIRCKIPQFAMCPFIMMHQKGEWVSFVVHKERSSLLNVRKIMYAEMLNEVVICTLGRYIIKWGKPLVMVSAVLEILI